ncbi:MAG: HD-GYP domain-containing protein [bacterium]
MLNKTRIYILLIAASSLYLAITHAVSLDIAEFAFPLVLLTLAAFLAQVYELELIPQYSLSTHIALVLAAVYIGGLPLAAWVVLVATIPAEILLRLEKLSTDRARFFELVAFNVGQLLLSAAAAAFVFSSLGRYELFLGTQHVEMLAAFLAYMMVNFSLVAGVMSLSSDARFTAVVRFGLKTVPLQFITMGVLAILMHALYREAPYNLALVFVPLALVHYSVRNYLRLKRDSHQAFRRITELLEQRDQYTGDHSVDVEVLSEKLSRALCLNDDQIEAVCRGAAVHDIGKIAIPDAILHKQGPLTDEEFETMKTHTTIGAEIVQTLDIYRDVVPIVRHEHEHWDGRGYPDGLAGSDIPLGARVVAVADVYSALTTERPYRLAVGKPLAYEPRQACEILREMAGVVLDPELVDVFVRKVIAQ